MTGGTVVILGEIGINFGAGMTGGLAWVVDHDGDIVAKTRYHDEFLEAVAFDACTAEEKASLRGLLEEHVRLTDSVLASGLLGSWEEASKDFVLFRPKPQA
jgi:glutamate synthase (NADPH/NADH) large chain